MRLVPPKQARSDASLARILKAARELLETSSFEELSVAGLARRARSSVGAFYGRFADKQALLEQLAEVYAGEAHAAVQAFAGARAQGAGDLEGELEAVVDFAIHFHRERAGVVRALLLEARARPGGRVAERVRRMKALPPTLERRILAHRAAIAHPDPEWAVAEGFFVVLAAVRERVIFGGEWGAEMRKAAKERGPGPGDEAGFAELLTTAWMAILRAPRGHPAAPTRPALYSS
jgi:AcrR family transcriptional regulator